MDEIKSGVDLDATLSEVGYYLGLYTLIGKKAKLIGGAQAASNSPASSTSVSVPRFAATVRLSSVV